ncbi:glycosyl hydrolase family 65 protein [Haloechinothrix salitolerans]|uniref:Glycosyl hydrolase family 65 protein n=1 Tax=Haloechinothrix salitolerans TaxID=926830 RepID=A0ABW2C3F9_9PSEU
MAAPYPEPEPGWAITWHSGDRLPRAVADAVLTIGAHGLATRGVAEEAPADARPVVLASGVYDRSVPGERLLPLPSWTGLDIDPAPAAWRQTLDLRTGVLTRTEAPVDHQRPLRTVRFVSAVRPGIVVLRAEATPGRVKPGDALRAYPGTPQAHRTFDGQYWLASAPGIAVAATHIQRDHDGVEVTERIAAYDTDGTARAEDLIAAVRRASEAGFDRLLTEHRTAWAARWTDAGVEIDGDTDAELALRYALFQLWCNVGGTTEAAVGARGLSGGGYDGHVFWDADVFILPAVASMAPDLARAMVSYRLHRLPAAKSAAAERGYAGARFPWESASLGVDVTPVTGDLGGETVAIKTGLWEEHITADVAWSAWHYARWSDDTAFLRGPGRQLLVATARYWTSRCRLAADGTAHIDTVIGPDEYHEGVSDNAFTNIMARWNLRTAAELVERATGSSPETRRWRRVAATLVDGYQPGTGRYEQFAGYFALDPLRIDAVATPPVAADVLLGRQRVARSQLIKQPDVLMAHHLLPDEPAPGSLVSNLDFYGPRTAHGSSLSPAIGASLLARAGRPDDALAELRTALRLDLDDVTGTTAGGLHLGAIGGCWQAVLFGFAGARVADGVLWLDPVLPSAWSRLGLRFGCLGRRVRLDIDHDDVAIETDGPLRVRLPGHADITVTTRARVALRTSQPRSTR